MTNYANLAWSDPTETEANRWSGWRKMVLGDLYPESEAPERGCYLTEYGKREMIEGDL
jgi:hypothetical protein